MIINRRHLFVEDLALRVLQGLMVDVLHQRHQAGVRLDLQAVGLELTQQVRTGRDRAWYLGFRHRRDYSRDCLARCRLKLGVELG